MYSIHITSGLVNRVIFKWEFFFKVKIQCRSNNFIIIFIINFKKMLEGEGTYCNLELLDVSYD